MAFYDAHCHLQDERIAGQLDAVLARAATAGVAGMLCCGSAETDWHGVQALALRCPAVHPAYGLHPWYAAKRSAHWLDTLRRHLEDPRAVVGEIGLDRALDPATFAAQEDVFLAQIRLAAEWRRPVSVHCRRAWGRLMDLLDSHGWPPEGVVLHSYSGGAELVAPLVRRGAFFSFSGAVTHAGNRRGREAAAVVPPDRLLIETDTPDIPPQLPEGASAMHGPDGRAFSEPAQLPWVAAAVAGMRGTDLAGIAALSMRNAQKVVFGAR